MKYSKCKKCKYFSKSRPLTIPPEKCSVCVNKKGNKLIFTLFEPRGDESGVMAT